jgi:hypothetical protein
MALQLSATLQREHVLRFHDGLRFSRSLLSPTFDTGPRPGMDNLESEPLVSDSLNGIFPSAVALAERTYVVGNSMDRSPNNPAAANPAMTTLFHICSQWRGVAEPER